MFARTSVLLAVFFVGHFCHTQCGGRYECSLHACICGCRRGAEGFPTKETKIKNACMYIRVYVRICVHTCMHACMHACIHTHILHAFVHTYVDMYICTHLHVSLSLSLSLSFSFSLYIYFHIHTYKYVYAYVYMRSGARPSISILRVSGNRVKSSAVQ